MGPADRIHAKPQPLVLRAALLALFVVQACATDCSSGDWRERGYNDGFAGHPPQDLRLERDCPRQGVQFSASEYLAGWRDGHDEYDRIRGSIEYD
jgi:ribosome modulation factor